MITTNLTGNFGNHMWQYSVCRTIAEKLGFEWGINPSPTHDYFKGMNQMYFMNVDFGVPYSLFANKDFKQFFERWINYRHVDNVNVTMLDPRIYDIEDDTILLGHNGAKGGLFQSEDYLIDRKEDIRKWFSFKSDYVNAYELQLAQMGIVFDDDLCVINFRGGEYRNIPTVLLHRQYWADAIHNMQSENKNMKFLIITDDIPCAKSFMPFDIPAIHKDIGFDYYVVNKAHWLIISNSSFGWWPAWLNTNARLILAPKYWARYNVSDGYWATGDVYTRGFTYLGREGQRWSYERCKADAIEYYKKHSIIS